MIKFTTNQNKAFWDKYAKNSKQNPFGAHTDKHVVNLENDFIISQLKIKNFESLLDIGCGNGQRTILFSKYVKGNVLGIDYSKEMIDHAKFILSKQTKTIKSKVSFEAHDIQNFNDDTKYDVIISCRCFVNQVSHSEQVKLFRKLYEKLNPKGSLIISEISEEGNKRLINMRKKHGLKPTKPRNSKTPNLYLNETQVLPKISNLFKIIKIRRGGVFYYISRIIHPVLVLPDEPDSDAKINDLALQSEFIFQKEIPQELNNFENYGEHLLVHFIKK
jgi:2-polyprenyl-3-methyl-5-hydroxy-6-metoxy-1,4-benzoquinol methylase